MRTSHRKPKPTPKTDADRAAIRRRAVLRRYGYMFPTGALSCAYCHRPVGRDMDAVESGELRKTKAGNWICCRHKEFKTAKEA